MRESLSVFSASSIFQLGEQKCCWFLNNNLTIYVEFRTFRIFFYFTFSTRHWHKASKPCLFTVVTTRVHLRKLINKPKRASTEACSRMSSEYFIRNVRMKRIKILYTSIYGTRSFVPRNNIFKDFKHWDVILCVPIVRAIVFSLLSSNLTFQSNVTYVLIETFYINYLILTILLIDIAFFKLFGQKISNYTFIMASDHLSRIGNFSFCIVYQRTDYKI